MAGTVWGAAKEYRTIALKMAVEPRRPSIPALHVSHGERIAPAARSGGGVEADGGKGDGRHGAHGHGGPTSVDGNGNLVGDKAVNLPVSVHNAPAQTSRKLDVGAAQHALTGREAARVATTRFMATSRPMIAYTTRAPSETERTVVTEAEHPGCQRDEGVVPGQEEGHAAGDVV
jgi:hypothetical protein